MNAATSTLSKPRTRVWNFCWRRSSGLTFITNGSPRSALSDACRLEDRVGSNIGSASEDRCPDADQRRAFLDRDFKVVAHPHGKLVQHRAIHAACQKPLAHIT